MFKFLTILSVVLVFFIAKSICHPTLGDNDNIQLEPATGDHPYLLPHINDDKQDLDTKVAPRSSRGVESQQSTSSDIIQLMKLDSAKQLDAGSQQQLDSQETLSRHSRSIPNYYDSSSEEHFNSREAVAHLFRSVDRLGHKCHVSSPCCCGWYCCRCYPSCQWYSREDLLRGQQCRQRSCWSNRCNQDYWQRYRCQQTYYFTPRPWKK